MVDEEILKIKELFQGLVPSFGITHAKVYRALMGGEIKTASQLSQETLISKNKIYAILKDLIQEKIVVCTNTSPINYHVKEPSKIFERLVSQEIALLEKKQKLFDEILSGTTSLNEKEYLIKFSEKQTKLFDNKNKALVKEPAEAKLIVQQLNTYIRELKPKKEHTYAIYR